MITPDHLKRAPKKLLEALEDPEGVETPPSWELVVGGHQLTERLMRGWTVEHQDGGPIVADLQLVGRLPRTLVNAPARLVAYVNDFPLLMLDGIASRPQMTTSTKMLINSPGAYLDVSKLDADISYTGTPAQLARQVIYGSKLYHKGRVRIDNLGQHIERSTTTTEQTGFTRDQNVSDVLSSIATETGAVWQDTVDRGISGFLPPGVAGSSENVRWHYDSDDEISFQIDSDFLDLVNSVVAYQPAQPDAVPPVAGFSYTAPVRYRHMPYHVPEHQKEYISISDTTGGGFALAKQQARKKARQYGLQEMGATLAVPFNHFLRTWDEVQFSEDVYDARNERWRYKWLFTITSHVTHHELIETEISGKVRLLNQERVPEPIEVVLPVTGVVVPTTRPSYAVEGDDIYFDYPLSWVQIGLTGNAFNPVTLDGTSRLYIDPVQTTGWSYTDGTGRLFIDSATSTGIASTDDSGRLYLDPGYYFAGEDDLVFDLLGPASIDGDDLVIIAERTAYGVEADDIYFDYPLSWAATEGDDLILDSAGPVFVSGDDIAVNA